MHARSSTDQWKVSGRKKTSKRVIPAPCGERECIRKNGHVEEAHIKKRKNKKARNETYLRTPLDDFQQQVSVGPSSSLPEVPTLTSPCPCL
jgi:hypothetical protein